MSDKTPPLILGNIFLLPASFGNESSRVIACADNGTRCSCFVLVCAAGMTHNLLSKSISDQSAFLTDPDRTAVSIKN